MREDENDTETAETELAELAEIADLGLIRELLGFVKQEKRWFLLPILVVLLLAGVFVVLSGTAVAPFIYALF